MHSPKLPFKLVRDEVFYSRIIEYKHCDWFTAADGAQGILKCAALETTWRWALSFSL